MRRFEQINALNVYCLFRKIFLRFEENTFCANELVVLSIFGFHFDGKIGEED